MINLRVALSMSGDWPRRSTGAFQGSASETQLCQKINRLAVAHKTSSSLVAEKRPTRRSEKWENTFGHLRDAFLGGGAPAFSQHRVGAAEARWCPRPQ